uniref:Carboxypeptidase n=1 Tax=Daucus carota subsp. sativus TaxID=79200 RepID=A0A166JFP7_DAUCS
MTVNTFLSIFIFCILLCFGLIQSAPETALVTHLPGFNGAFPSKHYSGYVPIGAADGKKLFYYFVLSERNPTEDPVVLWLNGGPGCSSFDGFVYEHGPFNFEKGDSQNSLPKLHLNPYSWSKVSNIIYLDSPAGVGFSYSGNESDYITGDQKTAIDSHKFLLKWFELYPEFLDNPFYIVGESYAGIYVPTLSFEVVKGIDANVKPAVNFKGYMVGNGCTDDKFDGNALVPFAHGMGLISDELYQEVITECQGNFYNPANDNCESKLGKVDREISGLNIYDILEPCYHGSENKITTVTTRLPQSFRKLGETERPLPVRTRMFGRAWPLRATVRDGIVPTWPQLLNSGNVPCTDDEVATSWLNDETVRKAIHAEQASVAGEWVLCTGRISFRHDTGSMIKYHRNLTSRGIRALIFSEAWTRSMGYEIVDEWRPWIVKEQVAGYIQGYGNNLTFLTVKGSGHTVPEYKPAEALAFYSRWLAGEKI